MTGLALLSEVVRGSHLGEGTQSQGVGDTGQALTSLSSSFQG